MAGRDAGGAAETSTDDWVEPIDVVRAAFAFRGETPNELSFAVNTVVYVLEKFDNGWWYGQLEDGTAGYFPGTHVVPFEDRAASAEQSSHRAVAPTVAAVSTAGTPGASNAAALTASAPLAAASAAAPPSSEPVITVENPLRASQRRSASPQSGRRSTSREPSSPVSPAMGKDGGGGGGGGGARSGTSGAGAASSPAAGGTAGPVSASSPSVPAGAVASPLVVSAAPSTAASSGAAATVATGTASRAPAGAAYMYGQLNFDALAGGQQLLATPAAAASAARTAPVFASSNAASTASAASVASAAAAGTAVAPPQQSLSLRPTAQPPPSMAASFVQCVIAVQACVRRWLARRRTDGSTAAQSARARFALERALQSGEAAVTARLRTVQSVFVDKLAQAAMAGLPGFGQAEVQLVFGLVAPLADAHAAVAARLRARQVEPRVVPFADVGAALDALPLLYSQYASRYIAGQAVLARAQERTPQLARFVRSLERTESLDGAGLRQLLRLPLEHFSRMLGMLRQLLSLTPAEHADHAALVAAMGALTGAAEAVRTAYSDGENFAQVLELQASFVGEFKAQMLLVEPHRRFVRQGVLADASLPGAPALHWLLFNDALVCAERLPPDALKFRALIMLSAVRVDDLPSSPAYPHAFRLTDPDRVTHTLLAASAEEKATWLRDIRAAQEAWSARAGSARASPSMQASGGRTAPQLGAAASSGASSGPRSPVAALAAPASPASAGLARTGSTASAGSVGLAVPWQGSVHKYSHRMERWTPRWASLRDGVLALFASASELHAERTYPVRGATLSIEDGSTGSVALRLPASDPAGRHLVRLLVGPEQLGPFAAAAQSQGALGPDAAALPPTSPGSALFVAGASSPTAAYAAFSAGAASLGTAGPAPSLVRSVPSAVAAAVPPLSALEALTGAGTGAAVASTGGSAAVAQDTYTGDQRAGRPHGRGLMRYAAGGAYEGEWRDGERCGTGTMRYRNGDVYSGVWVGGRRANGAGTMQYANGARYEGEWVGEVPHGFGVRCEPNGDVYEGRWAAGMRDGRGVLRGANGSLWYDGEWSADRWHGRGWCLYASGDVVEGEWRAGSLVRVFRCGTTTARPVPGQSLADFASRLGLAEQPIVEPGTLERMQQQADAQVAAVRAENDELQRALAQHRAELDRITALAQQYAEALAAERAAAAATATAAAASARSALRSPLSPPVTGLSRTSGSQGSQGSRASVGSGSGSGGTGTLTAAIMALFVLPVETLSPNEAAALDDALQLTAARLRQGRRT